MIIDLKFKSLSASIESKGAELKSLKKDGKEYMWCADPEFWGKTSPVLFPMIGTLKDGKTLINGTEYSISKHGFARDLEFAAEKESESSAVFILKNSEYTERMYPFEFAFSMKYTIGENGITIEYFVENKSAMEMPFCIGAHPAFACPIDESESFEDYALVFAEKETASVPLYNLETGLHEEHTRTQVIENNKALPLKHELFYNDVLYFDKIRSRSVILSSTKSNACVKVIFSGFETLGVWQPKNAPFLCIEPWCGSADFDDCSGVFAQKRGIQLVKPNEIKRYSLRIDV